MKAASLTSPNPRISVHRRRTPVLADGVCGMLIFVATEVMFFTALVSAFVIIKADIEPWAPPLGIRLPALATAANTVLLFLSGVFLYLAGRRFNREGPGPWVGTLLGGAAVLGACFVLFQGIEWMRLLGYGMTMTSGIFGACFFLLIGTHGLHAAAAATAMMVLYVRLARGELKLEQLQAMQVFWYFVLGIWPLLYGLVYF
jgi:heme/copper-type cytochrome/quinol oxidase subunit 3